MGRDPRSSALGLAALATVLAALLSGCAPAPDPEATRDSLAEVTAAPPPPEVLDEYDAEMHPEPIVDPIDCTPYLVLTARGTGEPTRGQLLSPVARLISDARSDRVQTIDLDYPADTDVKVGGTAGARTLIDTLNVQAQACPEQRFVLLGYSQGALIVGDALASPDTRLVGQAVGEITTDASERIRAIVFYGNPRFNGGEPYNAGSFSAAANGLLPRPKDSLKAYEGRIRDYCVARDFVCQSSFDLDEQGHVTYFENGMQQDGAAFAIALLDPASRADAQRDDAQPDDDAQPGDS